MNKNLFLKKFLKDKRSIIRVLNDDNYCLVYALLFAWSHFM